MRRILSLCLGLSLLAAAPFVLAYDTNVDLKKQGGETAWDIAIVLAGHEDTTNTYDGFSTGHFQTVTVDSAGANTVIHWENPTGSIAGDGIDDGEVVHVGFSTADGDASIADSYWTDENGARIFGSTVLIVGGHVGSDWVAVENTFPMVADIRSIRVGTFAAALPLAALNAHNADLLAQLVQVSGPMTLPPGGTVSFSLPEQVAPGGSVVLLVEAGSPESQAVTMTFQQRSF